MNSYQSQGEADMQPKKSQLLIRAFVSVAALALLAMPAFAQGVAFQSTSLPRQVRSDGITETLGEVVLQNTSPAGATIPATSSITIVYNVAITNTPGNGNLTCVIAGAPAPCPGTPTVTFSANTLVISFATAAVLGVGDSYIIAGVRGNVSTLGIAGSGSTGTVTATLSGSSSAPTTQPITFTQAQVPVASVPPVSFTTVVSAPIPSLLSCAVPAAAAVGSAFTLTVTERFPAAMTTTGQETTASGAPQGSAVTNGSQLRVTFTGVPAGMVINALGFGAITPVSVPVSAVALVGGAAFPSQSATSTGAAITFTYFATGTNTGVAETIPLNFSIGLPGGGAGFVPPLGVNATVTAAVDLVPVTAATATTVRFVANAQGGGTVATVGDCVTNLLFPFITNQVGFNTSLQIANTTADDLAFGTGAGAAAQSGACTLTFYPTDLTTQTSAAAGTLGAATQTTTPAIPSGGTYQVLQSATSFAGQSGYAFAVCRFLNAHGFSFVLNGSASTATISQGLLALVIPAPVGTRGAVGGAGEALNN